ncbi:hypothetical protein QO010_001022 [Caulobacter ginsengisoli]|uniref:Uncharacterized protein n=1 Tax=Caulobacter ginsengisoli TaxID=400775 RepID=A0ABU0IQH3_9CAUL|nr:hypothetical protein [Caulobacter ginsengisoli]MDQ0463274.1 hypothetical protein [Caulobacter ginsengisoli]
MKSQSVIALALLIAGAASAPFSYGQTAQPSGGEVRVFSRSDQPFTVTLDDGQSGSTGAFPNYASFRSRPTSRTFTVVRADGKKFSQELMLDFMKTAAPDRGVWCVDVRPSSVSLLPRPMCAVRLSQGG